MKRKRQLSRYDTVFLFMLAIGILLVLARYRLLKNPPVSGGDAQASITYTVRADSEPQMQTLCTADAVYLADGGALLGTQTSPPAVSPAKIEVTRRNGTIALLDSPTAYELRGTLSALGTSGEHGFFLPDGRHIAANQSLEVQINELKVTILILEISVF